MSTPDYFKKGTQENICMLSITTVVYTQILELSYRRIYANAKKQRLSPYVLCQTFMCPRIMFTKLLYMCLYKPIWCAV